VGVVVYKILRRIARFPQFTADDLKLSEIDETILTALLNLCCNLICEMFQLPDVVYFSRKLILHLFISKRSDNDLLSLFDPRRQQSDVLVQQLRRRLEEYVQLGQILLAENKEQLHRQRFVLKDRGQ